MRLNRLPGLIVAVLGTAAMVWLSAFRVESGDGAALLRLSWRTQPIRVESCRTLTEEEQAALPSHMRRTEECSGGFVDYELDVMVDGVHVMRDTVGPTGARRDRPIYVLRDHRLEPGVAEVSVALTALVPEDYVEDGRPVRLEWSGVMDLAPGEIGLLTVDRAGNFARR